MAAIDEIKNSLKEKRIIIGSNSILEKLKLGQISKVFLSSNCPESVKEDVNYYSGLSSTKVENLDIPNDELGAVCKKPFSISMLGVLKQ